MHIYAFGSICRGDVTPGSDIDLLAVTQGHDPRFDLATFSIYSYARLREIWKEGNPFAWHLFLESRLLFAEDGTDFLQGLGAPARYCSMVRDCDRFARLFQSAREAVSNKTNSIVFELSTIFLAVRNFATCFSLGFKGRPDFSRRSALRLDSLSLPIASDAFEVLERARILSTRGAGASLSDTDVERATRSFDTIAAWMKALSAQARFHE